MGLCRDLGSVSRPGGIEMRAFMRALVTVLLLTVEALSVAAARGRPGLAPGDPSYSDGLEDRPPRRGGRLLTASPSVTIPSDMGGGSQGEAVTSATPHIRHLLQAIGVPGQQATDGTGRPCNCTDAPPQGSTCQQLRDAGDCFRSWVESAQLCQTSCGRCNCPGACACTDIPPGGGFTCQQQAAWNKCNEPWMSIGFCQLSCGRCTCNNSSSSSSSPQPASSPVPTPSPEPAVASLLKLPAALNSTAAAPASTEAAAAVPALEAPPRPAPSPEPTARRPPIPEAALPFLNALPAANPPAAPRLTPAPSPAPTIPSSSEDVPSLEELLAPVLKADGPSDGGECRADLMGYFRGTPDLFLFGYILSLANYTQFGLPLDVPAGASVPSSDSSNGPFSMAPEGPPGITLFVPTNTAVRQFLRAQNMTAQELASAGDKLASVVAYHILPEPLAYPDLVRNGGRTLQTELPGAVLNVHLTNATSVEVKGAASSADLQRSNIVLCNTILHVVDGVLLPASPLSQVVPFSEAEEGLAGNEAQAAPMAEPSQGQPAPALGSKATPALGSKATPALSTQAPQAEVLAGVLTGTAGLAAPGPRPLWVSELESVGQGLNSAAGQAPGPGSELEGAPAAEPAGAVGGSLGGCINLNELLESTPEFSRATKIMKMSGSWDMFFGNATQPPAPSPPEGQTVLLPLNSAIDTMLAPLSPAARTALATSGSDILRLLAYETMIGKFPTTELQNGQVLETSAVGPQGRLALTVRRNPLGQITFEGVANSARIVYPNLNTCQGVVHAMDAVLLPVLFQAYQGP